MKQAPWAQRYMYSALCHRGSLPAFILLGNNANCGRNSHLWPDLLSPTASEEQQERRLSWAQMSRTETIPEPPDVTCDRELEFRSVGCKEKWRLQVLAVAMPPPCPPSADCWAWGRASDTVWQLRCAIRVTVDRRHQASGCSSSCHKTARTDPGQRYGILFCLGHHYFGFLSLVALPKPNY